jgi:alkylated DNA repair dioxygenase AlkB
MEGLILYEDIITKQEEEDIINFLDTQQWDHTLSRLTQHYGYRYDYRTSNLSPTQDLPLPLIKLLKSLMKRVKQLNKQSANPPLKLGGFDQCIINNYTKGQMISKHIDNPHIFDNIILSLSLGSEATMVFKNKKHEVVNVLLRPRTLLIMKDDCRYNWTHELKPLEGNRRISITYRLTK